MKILQYLENESIYIFREAARAFKKPVLLYSGGKDSCVMLHLARKAFFPENIPFPVLHIDTGWKFSETISFRDAQTSLYDLNLIIYKNRGVNLTPFDSDIDSYVRKMKTEALKQALVQYSFDAAIGGARRDEEKIRAKERIFSVRSSDQKWDPTMQRPEIWNVYNTKLAKSDTMRIFPLSNWTEHDIWRYIAKENIKVVPLYFSLPRPIVRRHGQLIMVDDDRFPLHEGEKPQVKNIRFRTLGCYPLTAALESQANNIDDIIKELDSYSASERSGRIIDQGYDAMESKKREGYF